MDGGSQTFTITPNPGKNIVDVLVDGMSNGTISSVYVYECGQRSYHHGLVHDNHPDHHGFGRSRRHHQPGRSCRCLLWKILAVHDNTGYPIPYYRCRSRRCIERDDIELYVYQRGCGSHDLRFVCDRQAHLTSSASPGGTIIPNGTIVVTYNATQSFTMIPNLGKNIVAVMVDGTDQGPVSSYTFTNIDATIR